MSNRKLIGRVSATEKYPSSCDDFQFWLADDAILSPFDIVRVENKSDDSITYGVVQDILHITDGTGHLSNYVSSDFGNVDTTPMTRRLSLSYAKVSVIHNTKENFMPVFEGSPVYTADNEDIEIAIVKLFVPHTVMALERFQTIFYSITRTSRKISMSVCE